MQQTCLEGVDATGVTGGSALTKKFPMNPLWRLDQRGRNLSTHREVRVGSKTGGLPGQTWKTRVQAGRTQGADRGVESDAGQLETGGDRRGEHTAKAPGNRRRERGFNRRAPRTHTSRGPSPVMIPHITAGTNTPRRREFRLRIRMLRSPSSRTDGREPASPGARGGPGLHRVRPKGFEPLTF